MMDWREQPAIGEPFVTPENGNLMFAFMKHSFAARLPPI